MSYTISRIHRGKRLPRVHVVGDEVFACEVISPSDDHRYAVLQGQTVAICPYVLPPKIVDRCKKLASHIGLSIVGAATEG